MKIPAHFQKAITFPDHLNIFSLGQINLILNHLHHRPAWCQKVHLIKHMLTKKRGNPIINTC